MKDEWRIFGYTPMIIYRPDPQSMMIELAKSAMRMSITREIEQDALGAFHARLEEGAGDRHLRGTLDVSAYCSEQLRPRARITQPTTISVSQQNKERITI